MVNVNNKHIICIECWIKMEGLAPLPIFSQVEILECSDIRPITQIQTEVKLG